MNDEEEKPDIIDPLKLCDQEPIQPNIAIYKKDGKMLCPQYETCDETFDDLNHLINHLKTHFVVPKPPKVMKVYKVNDKMTCPYRETCDLTFDNFDSLTEHVAKHDQVQGLKLKSDKTEPTPQKVKKEWQCEKCHIKYKTQIGLKNHMATKHIGCHICKARFSTQKGLKNHIVNKHSVECEHCKKSFKKSSKLDQHLNEKHANELKCDKCDFATSSSQLLGIHMRNHAYKLHEDGKYHCDFCDFTTENKASIIHHR